MTDKGLYLGSFGALWPLSLSYQHFALLEVQTSINVLPHGPSGFDSVIRAEMGQSAIWGVAG